MHCPGCGVVVNQSANACEVCTLSMAELDQCFGVVPRHSKEITDSGRLFSDRARARLQRNLRLLRARFPQVRFSIFTCSIADRAPQAYGFWLFNRCRFHELGSNTGRCFSLLLVLNRADGTASLTAGYGLENLCKESDLESWLEAASWEWREGHYEKGVRILLGRLTAHLRAAADQPIQVNPLKILA